MPPLPRVYFSVAFGAAVVLVGALVAVQFGYAAALAGAIAAVSAAGIVASSTLLVLRERTRSRLLERSVAALREQVQGSLERDWLTGLITADEFWKALRREINRSRRYGRECSILVADVDLDAFLGSSPHAENVDPSYLARHLADLVKASLRESDTIARRSGVFGVKALLPETPAGGARIVASRLQQKMDENPIALLDGKRVALALKTVVVTYPSDGESVANIAGTLSRTAVIREVAWDRGA